LSLNIILFYIGKVCRIIFGKNASKSVLAMAPWSDAIYCGIAQGAKVSKALANYVGLFCVPQCFKLHNVKKILSLIYIGEVYCSRAI
jgi:hypothetical protein